LVSGGVVGESVSVAPAQAGHAAFEERGFCGIAEHPVEAGKGAGAPMREGESFFADVEDGPAHPGARDVKIALRRHAAAHFLLGDAVEDEGAFEFGVALFEVIDAARVELGHGF